MHAYVINLTRSLDRRAYITAELKKTDQEYEIIKAIDGRDLDLPNPALVDPSLPVKPALVAGTAGAALSHQSVYRKIIADGLDKALVLEDDVMLPTDLRTLADAVANQLVGAEVALLSVDSPSPCQMSSEGSIRLPGTRLLALPIDIRQPHSAGAYIITREACERMVKSAPPVQIQADAWWFYYREGYLDRVRCVVPLSVFKNPGLVSTIGTYSLADGLMSRLVGPLVRLKIPLLHQALARRRQRIFRQWSRSELVEMPFIEKPSRLG